MVHVDTKSRLSMSGGILVNTLVEVMTEKIHARTAAAYKLPEILKVLPINRPSAKHMALP